MYKIVLSFFVFICFLYSNEVTNYKVENQSIIYQDNIYRILRSFAKDKENFFLIVDEKSLKTKIVKKEELKNFQSNKNTNTKYQSLLDTYSKAPFTLQNYGLKSLNSNKIYLSVDMCPSSKVGYESEFYSLLALKNENTPLVVFISGRWIKTHESDFLELINFQKQLKLNIIWGNHTFTHFYDKFKKLDENFLLSKNSDVETEVLNLEKLLISYNQTPSILFRFPGLISDEKTVKNINSLGLIPLGSNSWLAKGEMPKNGSIILVHGNKNEPKGIQIANKLFEDKSLALGNLLDDL